MERRISGYEGYQRANFLYQAALNIFLINPKLAQLYIHEMRQICEKLVIRMSPQMKRNYCKKCSYLLCYHEKVVKEIRKKNYACVVCPGCSYEKRIKIIEKYE